MVKRGNLILLALSLVLALATTFVILRTLSQTKAANTATAVQTTSVVVVKQNVLPHQVIDATDVAVIQVPSSAVEPGAAIETSQVTGQYSLTTWIAGQQVVAGMYGNAQSTTLSATIPSGERAFTIPNSTLIGVDHLITPGDHVDIMFSTLLKPGVTNPNAQMTDLLVLYVDQIQAAAGAGKAQGGTGPDTLTLAVTPEQAQILAQLTFSGQFHVLIRSPSDH